MIFSKARSFFEAPHLTLLILSNQFIRTFFK